MATTGTFITLGISVLIILLFLFSLGKKNKRNYKNEIVSLGVLGTFIGIALGLYHFDVTDIKSSMPYLLDGLKTAFITSGVGIFFSIILSIYKPSKSNKTEAIEALELIVKDFNKNLNTQFGDNFKQLNKSVESMIIWQKSYQKHIERSEKSLNNVLEQLQNIEVLKEQEHKNVENIIKTLKSSTQDVSASLKESTDIVKEQMQLLLREANRKL